LLKKREKEKKKGEKGKWVGQWLRTISLVAQIGDHAGRLGLA